MRENKRIKAVIFDFDDTLIDWSLAEMSWSEFNRTKYDRLHEHYSQKGFDLPKNKRFADMLNNSIRREWEEKKQTWAGANFGDAMLAGLKEAGVAENALDLKTIYDVYNHTPFPGVAPFDDTHTVLKELKDRGYKIGLITNAFQPMSFRDVEINKYDLMKYLDARITSGDTRFMKPHPAIFWRMLGLLDLMPEDAIMIGDRPGHDVLGAHNVGMLGVLMSPSHLNRSLEGVEPDYTIESLSELLPILDALD